MKVARPFAFTTIMSAATFDSFSFTTFVASATRDTASRLICTEQYFAAYFSRLRLLEAHDRQTLRVNRLAEGLLLFQAGRLLLIYFSENLYFGSQFEHVLHFNIVRMEGLPGYFHLIGALYILMVVLMNRVIYFTNNGFSRTLLESLLIGGDCSVFIYQHFKVKKECIFWRYFLKQQKRGEGRGGLERLSWFNEEHLRISTLVLYFGVGLKNLLNVFFLLMLHLYLAEVFIVNLCYFSPIRSFTALLPLLLLYALNALLVLAGINALYHVLILTVTLGLLLMVVFVVGLRQAQQFALKEVLQQQQASAAAGNRRRYFLFCSRQLGRFLRHIDQLQRLLADASRVYGLAWFAFVLVNVPISSVLLMLLAMGKLRRQILLLAAILVGAQFLAINCISTASAVLSSRLHRPVRCLLGLLCCRNSGENLSLDRRRMMRISSLVALSVRLRLALHIQLFHTSNRLALSYGRYGKITFQSVGKILFFYLRFLIFAYKLVNTGQAHFGRQRPTLSSSSSSLAD